MEHPSSEEAEFHLEYAAPAPAPTSPAPSLPNAASAQLEFRLVITICLWKLRGFVDGAETGARTGLIKIFMYQKFTRKQGVAEI